MSVGPHPDCPQCEGSGVFTDYIIDHSPECDFTGCSEDCPVKVPVEMACPCQEEE